MKQPLLLFLLIGLTTLSSLAQTSTWTGTTSTDWNTPANWSTNVVPTASDNVVIPNAANPPTIGAATAALANSVDIPAGGGSLTIANSATLTINGSKRLYGYSDPTAFYNEGTVHNSGQLILGNLAAIGEIGLYNNGNFTNNAGGAIHIDRTSYIGLLHSAGNFTNAGSIVIGANAGVGNYGIHSQSAFTNSTGGQIQIDRSTSTGLFNQNRYAGFTNAGTIVIGANAGVEREALANYGGANFTNQGCAKLSLITGTFYNFSATFTQQGLMTVNTTEDHYNPAGFTNNGIIAYPQGNPIPNVTNNKLIVLPITTSCGVATSALQIGGSNDLTVAPTWYQNADLTTPAGTYSSNTFTATNLGTAGSYTLYFEVTDPVNGCSQTVSIPLQQPEVLAGISPSSATLTCTNATATLTASGGDTYLWSTGETASSINVTTEGTYSVTVSGANECRTSASATISEDKTPPTPQITPSATTVTIGQSVTLTASGGTTYEWSTGATTNPITVTPPLGNSEYSVTATAPNGCSASTSVSLNTTPPNELSLLAPVRLCVKSTPPANTVVTLPLTITMSGGQAPFTYSWSYKAPNSTKYKAIKAGGTSIGKVTFAPQGNTPSLNVVGSKGNLNGLQGYLIRLTVEDQTGETTSAETLLDGSCDLSSPNAREGVPQAEELQVRVYPNPVTDLLQVELRGLNQSAQVRLYDIQGRTRGEWTIEPVEGTGQLKAPVGQLSEGLYLLQVVTPEGVLHRQRVLKLR